MKRTIVVTAALLASVLSAHAASVKKPLRVANGLANDLRDGVAVMDSIGI